MKPIYTCCKTSAHRRLYCLCRMMRSFDVRALIRSSHASSHLLGCGMAARQMCALLTPAEATPINGRSTDGWSSSMHAMAMFNNLVKWLIQK